MLAAALVWCAGCGGGGGGSAPTTSLTLSVPTLTGQTGNNVNLGVAVSGAGSVNTATFDITFNSGSFGPTSGSVGDKSVELTTADGIVCRYRWLDATTVRVMYAGSTEVAAGATLVEIPVKVLAETNSGAALSGVLLNQ